MTRSIAFAGLLVLGTVAPAFADGHIAGGYQDHDAATADAAGHGCADWSKAWPAGTLQIDDRLAPLPPEAGQRVERTVAQADCELA